jgi:hypothetical protein
VFLGRKLEVYLLVLDQLPVLFVNKQDSLINISLKFIIELILDGAHIQLDLCQVDYILKLLE